METKKGNESLVDEPGLTIERIASEDEPTALETFGVSGKDGNKPQVITRGFQCAFGEAARDIAHRLLVLLKLEVLENGPIDYFQIFSISANAVTEKVWVIDDGSSVTVLLPEDY